MSAPKSVVKVDKAGGVTYTSNVDKVSYFLFELSRAAMRDVGKYLKKEFRIKFYQTFKKHTGNAPKSIKYQAISSKNTKYPRCEIGIERPGKNKVVGFYSYFHELGTSKHPAKHILRDVTLNNIPTIIKIESQYLSGLEDEAEALRLIETEDDYEDEEE